MMKSTIPSNSDLYGAFDVNLFSDLIRSLTSDFSHPTEHSPGRSEGNSPFGADHRAAYLYSVGL